MSRPPHRLYLAAEVVIPSDQGDTEQAMLAASIAQLAGDRGDLEVALTGWTRALRYMEDDGHLSEPMVRLNVAPARLKLQQLDSARSQAWRARRAFARTGRRSCETSPCALLATIGATDPCWADVGNRLHDTRMAAGDAELSEPDFAWSLETAGEHCAEAGQHALAGEALQMAHAHDVVRMARHDAGARVQALLDAPPRAQS